MMSSGKLAIPVLFVGTAALLLAGCTVALPGPVTLEEAGTAVTDPAGALWVARDRGCSSVAGAGADQACAVLTLLYHDGTVLQADYGQGGPRQVEGVAHDEGARSGLTFVYADDDAAFRDEITAAWTAMHGAAPDLVRVHDVRAYRIAPTEREGVLRVVDAALAKATPLPPPTFDCQDCAAPRYWAFGAPQEFSAQAFGSPGPEDSGWVLIEGQMQRLQAWLDGTAASA